MQLTNQQQENGIMVRRANENGESAMTEADPALHIVVLTDDVESENSAKRITANFARGCLGEHQRG
jgi:hypothetical protein